MRDKGSVSRDVGVEWLSLGDFVGDDDGRTFGNHVVSCTPLAASISPGFVKFISSAIIFGGKKKVPGRRMGTDHAASTARSRHVMMAM